MSTRSSVKMEKQIKKAVDEALAGSGLLTKDDMESMISKLEARVLDCIQAEIAKATKPLEARVQALEKKIEIYDAHFANLEQKLDDAEQHSRRSCLRIIIFHCQSRKLSQLVNV